MSLLTQSLSAASQGNIGTLSSLQRQVNLNNCLDKFGAGPVHYAARTGRLKCLQWLVEIAGLSGTKPANNGATPAHDAAATGQLECLQWLVDCGGCSETVRDACGATPLHLAARFGHLNVVAWLVESKNCSALHGAQNGVTPVHLSAAKGSINCLKWLSQTHPSSVNARADNGTTPAYFAAQEGKLECLKFLAMEADADLQIRASDGMLPIHAAAQMGHLDCLSWMIENTSLSLNEKDNDGATPMHFAAARGHIEILRWLVCRGCSATTDDLGGTPLHDAAEHGQLEALKVLVASGMDTDVRDMDGLTAADVAEECDQTECVQFLRSPSQIRKVKLNAEEYLRLKSQRQSEVVSLSSNEVHHNRDVRKQDSRLLSEVRTFESVALKSIPQTKKNLHHMKLGHITEKPFGKDTQDMKKEVTDGVLTDHEEQTDLPIQKTEEKTPSKEGFKSTPKKQQQNIPAWKRALLDKKVSTRAEDSLPSQVLPSKHEQKKQNFDALPEWKKKLILQKQSKS